MFGIETPPLLYLHTSSQILRNTFEEKAFKKGNFGKPDHFRGGPRRSLLKSPKVLNELLNTKFRNSFVKVKFSWDLNNESRKSTTDMSGN